MTFMDRKLSEMDKQVNKILEQEWIKEIDKILKHIYQGYQVTKTGKIITIGDRTKNHFEINMRYVALPNSAKRTEN